jgi:hypothetical protein
MRYSKNACPRTTRVRPTATVTATTATRGGHRHTFNTVYLGGRCAGRGVRIPCKRQVAGSIPAGGSRFPRWRHSDAAPSMFVPDGNGEDATADGRGLVLRRVGDEHRTQLARPISQIENGKIEAMELETLRAYAIALVDIWTSPSASDLTPSRWPERRPDRSHKRGSDSGIAPGRRSCRLTAVVTATTATAACRERTWMTIDVCPTLPRGRLDVTHRTRRPTVARA